MFESLETKNQHKNILIVAITRLGDMLQASPTIVGLKEQYPDSRITVVIDKQFATICSGIPGIDEIYVMDLSFVCRNLHREQDGIVEAFKYVKEVVHDLREREFDYCLNMSNSAYTALLIKMLNVKENRGWLSDEEGFRIMADPWAMLFSAIVYHSNRDYNALNLVDIFRCAAEVTKHPRQLRYNIPDDARSFAESFLEQNGIASGGPLVLVQAGASQAKRQWSPQRFSRLTQLLVEDLGARVVFTGSLGERSIVDQILAGYSHPRVVSSLGQTNFDQLGGLLEKADVLVTGDTGPMHMSVAVGTPVVAMFLASALGFETGPYSAGNFVIQPQITCSPCNPNYPCSRPDCHTQVSPELVAYLTRLRVETPLGAEQTIYILPSIANPREVVVHRTDFDQDGFLVFESMNGVASRHGEPLGFYETSRSAYRALWKEEFADIPFAMFPREQCTGEIPQVHPTFEGLYKTVALCNQGCACLEQLVRIINDQSSPTQALGEINYKLQMIDKELESVSLAYPLLGALIRIFIMEKENLRGDDPLLLAKETEELYRKLCSRSERFGHLFVHFYERFKGTSA